MAQIEHIEEACYIESVLYVGLVKPGNRYIKLEIGYDNEMDESRLEIEMHSTKPLSGIISYGFGFKDADKIEIGACKALDQQVAAMRAGNYALIESLVGQFDALFGEEVSGG